MGFGSERRATLQFYFDRRISFVKHAVQRITIIISPPYVFEEGGRKGGARTHPSSLPWLVNVDRIPFLQIILPLRAFEHAAFLPPFSSRPRKHNKSSLSLQFLQSLLLGVVSFSFSSFLR